MTNSYAPDLSVFIGASGSGKTTLIKSKLRARTDGRARLIWSWKELLDCYAPEFGRRVDGEPARMLELCEAGESVVYVPSRSSDELIARQFDFFCSLALSAGERVTLVEEMSVVANSRSSPARWKQIVTEGRGLGLVPMAATQAPQLCDVTIMDAATEIYCGRLNRGSSKKIMADLMGGLPAERISPLNVGQFLRWQTGVDGAELVNVEFKKRRRSRSAST